MELILSFFFSFVAELLGCLSKRGIYPYCLNTHYKIPISFGHFCYAVTSLKGLYKVKEPSSEETLRRCSFIIDQ